MLRRTSWLVSALALSCAVRGFSIVDELPDPAAGAGGTGTNAGVSSGATTSSGGTNAGASSGGKAQGGQAPQAGTPNQGGTPPVEAGAPAVGEAGAGGGGSEEPAAVEPCALDQSGMQPLLCEDFQAMGALNPQKWLNPPPGIESMPTNGPHGMTRALEMLNFQLHAAIGDFNLQAAGSDVTVSFWFKSSATAQQGASLVSFRDQSAQATQLRLVLEVEGITLRSATMAKVPSQPNEPIPQGDWTCLAMYLTTGLIQVIYKGTNESSAHEFTADSVLTPGVDDTWQNQPEDQKRVAGFPVFGADPVLPGAYWLDDIRIARGNSNVCGF